MAALPTIPDTIDYADLAIGLCANNNGLGALYGKRIAAPSSPVTQTIVNDALRWAYEGGAVPASQLRQMANYVVWLTSPYFSTAKSIITGGGGGGSVVPGGGSGYAYVALPYTITADSTTFQTNDLILGKDLGFVLVDDQTFQLDKDFTVNYVTGTITFTTITLFVDSKLILPFNKKL